MVTLFVNVIAGITIISNAVFMLSDLTRIAAASIAPLFGLVSIFNALGRCLWGAISDRIGCRHTFAAMFAVQAVTVLLLAHTHALLPVLAAVSVILLCCGGGFGTMPSFNASCFGTKFMGLNYGLILSAWGFAGLIGPILIARAKDLSGSFSGMLPLIAVVLATSVILPYLTKKPALKSRAAVTGVHRFSPCPSLGRFLSATSLNPRRSRHVLSIMTAHWNIGDPATVIVCSLGVRAELKMSEASIAAHRLQTQHAQPPAPSIAAA